MKKPNKKMEAEPSVVCQGIVSDASEHIPILNNQAANTMADEMAIKYAVSSGMFTEEAKALMSGPRSIAPTSMQG